MMINWKEISTSDQMSSLKEESTQKPVVLFKHSTRCSISRTVLDRLNRHWKEDEIGLQPYYLDLLTYRNISNQIEAEYSVQHESPQVIVVSHGKAIYHASHLEIDYTQIKNVIRAAASDDIKN